MTDVYTPEEQEQLLNISRHTLEVITEGYEPTALDLNQVLPKLREPRACFVTLNSGIELRGCTGTLAPRGPLAQEVVHTTVGTAFYDPRFPPVDREEVPYLQIEISVLTPSQPLEFATPADIPKLIRPGIDGVTLMIGKHRATFLPQVWDMVPDPRKFLEHLSQKMGLPSGAWLDPNIKVETYQTVIIEEHPASV
jgi:AmmeMemoRadiSam system protein A